MSWFRAGRAGEPLAVASVIHRLAALTPMQCVTLAIMVIGRVADQPELSLLLSADFPGNDQPLTLAWSSTRTPRQLKQYLTTAMTPVADDQVRCILVSLNQGDDHLRLRFTMGGAGTQVDIAGTVARTLLQQVPALLDHAWEHQHDAIDMPFAQRAILPAFLLQSTLGLGQGPVRCYSSCSVLELIEQRVRSQPDAPAAEEDDQVISYAQLWQRSACVASGLHNNGAGRGHYVAVLMARGIDWIVAMLGVLRAGAVYVPLNPKNPAARNLRMVEQAQIRLVIGPDLQPLGTSCPLSSLEQADAATHAPPEPHLDDDAYCIFTSGSTGEPKGIRISHGAFSNFVQSCPETFGTSVSAPPRHLQFCEASFDVHMFEVFHPLSLGGTVIVDPRGGLVSFDAYVQRLIERRVDTISPPTTFWHQWREQVRAGRSTIPGTLKRIIVAGELAQPEQFALNGLPAGVRLINGYGPAETNYCSAYVCGTKDATLAYVPVGFAMANVSLYVQDSKGHALPQGAVGEIVIGGAGVATGYVATNERDRARFGEITAPDGKTQRIYRSGDFGYFNRYNQLVCLGRGDQQIKIQGVRIEPDEVEVQLRRCEGVRAAVVYGVRQADEPAALAMALELAPGVTIESVIVQLAQQLPDYMVPRLYLLLAQWPVNANGKVDRHMIQSMPLRGVPVAELTGSVDDHQPQSGTVAQLQSIWQQVSKSKAPVELYADLRQLQLSSLRLGMFFAEIADHFDLDIAPTELFDLRTLRDVALRIEAEL